MPLARREARKLTHPVRPVATAAWHIRLQEVPTASAVSPPMTRALSLRMPTSTPNPPHPCPRTSPARYHSLTITELLLLSRVFKKIISQTLKGVKTSEKNYSDFVSLSMHTFAYISQNATLLIIKSENIYFILKMLSRTRFTKQSDGK